MWQFWIDVGGTFADCIAISPDGTTSIQKWLSSGVTKGVFDSITSPNQVNDPRRKSDPNGFWRGYRFRIWERGGACREFSVTDFDSQSGTFLLEDEIANDLVGSQYELFRPEPAPVQLVRYLLGTPFDRPIELPVSIRMGTTRGTNALLTRQGANVAWITTQGLADVLEIGTQDRPNIFAVDIVKTKPVHAIKLEIDERISADGRVLKPIDLDEVRSKLEQAKRTSIESLAICLLHADRFPEHEKLIAATAADLGFEEICCSHEVSPQIKIVSRGHTTLVDAYLNPVLRKYVQTIKKSLCSHPESKLMLMNSAGGLVDADRFSGKESVLSGPAGGVVAMSEVARSCGFDKCIGFDMGGTSTDVSRFEGDFELEYETRKAGVPIMTPTLAIETVAAGGGSICKFDGSKFVVGPQSAGANPGPACYGNGGPLTLTDVNLILGRLQMAQFPFRLSRDAAEQSAAELAKEIQRITGIAYSNEQLALGFLNVAVANMAQAIRTVSISKGYDPRDHALISFGGAAGQHVCDVAMELGIENAIVHPYSSLLSAYGMGLAKQKHHRTAGLYCTLSSPDSESKLSQSFAKLVTEIQELVSGLSQEYETIKRVDLRYAGTADALTIEFTQFQKLGSEFASAHKRLFGYVKDDCEIEIVALRIESTERTRRNVTQRNIPVKTGTARCSETASVVCTSGFESIPCFHLYDLKEADLIEGPALIIESNTTVFVKSGWTALILQAHEILLRFNRDGKPASWEPLISDLQNSQNADPVLLEVISGQLMAIATQMGLTLQKTSTSVNVKERLDFSCAIFRGNGDLVANAPHVPVHLGAMSETVKRVIEDNPSIHRDDVYVTNDPLRGGSHLPDVTVISPVFENDDDVDNPELLCFVACRAHHAEIGGISPGSMPPFSKSLFEEGVLIQNFKLFDRGQAKYDQLLALLTSGAYPSRSPDFNVRDIQAQVAANRQGIRDLHRLFDKYSWITIDFYMREIQSAAAAKMRAVLSQFNDQQLTFEDRMDDGSRIVVTITISGGRAKIDFNGTSDVVPNNLNANRAIVTAAIIYCLRLLIGEEIPLNQGVLEPVDLVLPECFLNPPYHEDASKCAAMVGGNVETSQRLVDTLLGAFGICAASQGTMNNLLFGNDYFGYYETICGGAGATRNAKGASAVHTHMTNTRMTDPEIMESRFPVRLHQFAIRDGSGGEGANRGGDGAIRSIEFLEPLRVSLLTQRRGDNRPYGKQGGEPGLPGENILKRSDGSTVMLNSLDSFSAEPGDRLTIKTPGGGGFGRKEVD